MKDNEVKFKQFEEECRRYLYEKEVIKELEKRFVQVNTTNTYFTNVRREDPLKKYRFLESHIRHVDDVFNGLERCYGSTIARKIKDKMIGMKADSEKDEESYKNIILHVLNMYQSGVRL